MKKYKQFIAILLFVLLLFFSGCFFNNNKNEVYKDQFGYDRDVSKVSCDAFIFSTNYFMDNYGTYIGDKGDANLVSEKLLSASPSGDRNIIYFIFCGKAQNINLKISSVELIDDSSNLLLDKKAITFGSASVYNFSIDDKKSNVKVKLDKQKNIDEMISLTTDTDISFFALSLDFKNPYYQYFKIVFNVEADGQTKQIVKQYGSNHNNLSIQKVTYDGNEVKDGDTLDIVLNQSKYLDLTFVIPRNYNYNFKVLVYTFKPNQIEINIDSANTADFEKLYNDDYQLISFNYSGSSGNDRKDFNIRLDIKEKVITESEIRIYFIPSFYNYSSFKFNLKDINDSTEIKNDEESIVYNNYSYYKVSNNNITSVTIPGYIDNKPVIIAKDAFKDFKNLKSVIIEEGAFGISKGAFSGCSSLESITIPNSITMVEDDAFLGANDNIFYKDNNCYYLGNENNYYLVLVKNTNLNIEQFEINTNTSVIAGGAFENCNKLESIKTLFVKGIGNYSFKNCTSLKEFNGNDYLSFLGEGIFSGCTSLDNLPISFIGFKNDSNNKFSIGYLFGSIPYNNSYETIATCLINNETVSKTFYMPYNLTTVKYNNYIIPEYIFAGAKYVKNFEIPNVAEINTGAFMNCESMEKFSSTQYCTLHDSCFENCTSLKEIELKVYRLEYENIFKGCQIEKATISSKLLKRIINSKLNYLSIDKINDDCISLLVNTCPKLSYLELTDSNTEYAENTFNGIFIDKAKITYSALLSLKNSVRELEVIDTSVTIPSYYFKDSKKLEKLILGPSIKPQEASLYGCSSLKSITTSLDSSTRGGFCYLFGSENEDSFENSHYVKQHINSTAGTINYNCPNDLVEINFIGPFIPAYYFENMTIEKLSIEKNFDFVDSAFKNTELTNIYYNGTFDEFIGKGKSYFNNYGALYILDENGKELYNESKYSLYCSILMERQIAINSYYYFENNKNIKEVIIPEGVTEIYVNAFKNCINLESIVIPNTVTSIGEDAFVNCSNLKSITIPNSINKLPMGIFAGCKSLESISLPFVSEKRSGSSFGNGVGYVFGDKLSDSSQIDYFYAASNFYLPNKLEKIYITDTKNLPGYAFAGCKYVKFIELSDKVESIGAYAFDGCHSLLSFRIPNKVTTIESWTFCCHSLVKLIVGESVQEIKSNSFDCQCLAEIYNLSDLDIIKKLTIIGNRDEIVVHNSLNDPSIIIEKDDFIFSSNNNKNYLIRYCGHEEDVVLPSNFISNGNIIDSYVLKGYSFNKVKANTLVVSEGVTIIENYAFMDADIIKLTLPSSLTSKPDIYVFCDSRIIENYNLSKFDINVGLVVHKSLDEPSLLVKDENGFIFTYYDNKGYLVKYDGNEKNIILPNSFIFNGSVINSYEIYSKAFYDDDKVNSVVLPISITAIGDEVFYNSKVSYLVFEKLINTLGNYIFYKSNLKKVYCVNMEEGDAEFVKDNYNNATLYVFTDNGENETKTGYWWYYDTDGKTIIEKIVR